MTRISIALALLLMLSTCNKTPTQSPVDTPVAKNDTPNLMRAEIHSPRLIIVDNIPSSDIATYTLQHADGQTISMSIGEVRPDGKIALTPEDNLDINAVHYLMPPKGGTPLRVRFDGWFRTLTSERPLGATVNIASNTTTIAIFTPRAQQVRLYLYEAADTAPEAAYQVIDLERDEKGIWTTTLPGNLHGIYYDFTVHGPKIPGSSFYETHPVHISDPYARVNVGSTGKSRIWHEAPTPSARQGGPLAMEDVVAYEVHVQDFTDLLPSRALAAGPLHAMATPGFTNTSGVPIGLDHLISLGVNTVHLMPIQEFLHHPDTDWRAVFSEEPRLQALGVATENYQWGYRTTHAFAIERRFGDPSGEPGNERAAFRALIDALHARGIAVIVDIVPNHTGENMDGKERLIHFNVLDKAYYYRTDEEVNHIGPFGNEVKTEDRPMVRRWLIEQCLSLINDFGVDGFRVDLAGQIDQQTLMALKEAVGPDVLIYGEPWIAISDPYVRANPDLAWYKEDSPITFFQDDARNAFKGSPFELSDKQRDRGYAGGNTEQRAEVKRALSNAYAEEIASPNLGLNYLDIHDNWTLADRFATSEWNGLNGVDEARYRIAAGLVLTSLGPVVLHGGVEIMRSKGNAPLEEWAMDTPFGDIHFKGRDDTYNLRAPNQFVWETVGTAPDQGALADYAGMMDWWSGLIRFRLSEAGKVFRRAETVPDGYYRWFTPDDPALLGYVVDEQVLVLVNVSEAPGKFTGIDLPAGNWVKITDGVRIDPVAGLAPPVAASELASIVTPATSLSIWVRQ